MFRLACVLIICVALAITASESTIVEGARPAAAPGVDVVDFEFMPASTTINVGDSVTWSWTGFSRHSVTSDVPGVFDSGILWSLDPDPTLRGPFTVTFDT